MKKIILFMSLLSSCSLFSQDYFTNKSSSFYLKVEGKNLSWFNESGRELLKMELPHEGFKKVLLTENGNNALLQDNFGNLFYADKNLKKISDLDLKIKDGFTSFAEIGNDSFLVGSNSGAVRSIEIQNQFLKKTAKFDVLVSEVGIPVKEIKFSKSKDMFYVFHQKQATEPVGFIYNNTLPKDIQTKPHQAIGLKPQDLTPSGFHKPIGFQDAPAMSNIELYHAQQENLYLRLKQNSQQLTVFNVNKEGKLVRQFVSNNFTTMWMADDFSDLVLSSNIEKKTKAFKFREILKSGEAEKHMKVFEGHVDFLERNGNRLVMANADESIVKFLSLDSQELTQVAKESNIRGIFNAERAKYIAYENGQVDVLASNDKFARFETIKEPGEKFARNLKPVRIGNRVIVLDDRGYKKELFLPKSCGSLF